MPHPGRKAFHQFPCQIPLLAQKGDSGGLDRQVRKNSNELRIADDTREKDMGCQMCHKHLQMLYIFVYLPLIYS